MRLYLSLFLLSIVPSAWAISRVGNCQVGDKLLGFVVDIPQEFPNAFNLEMSSVRLLSSKLYFDDRNMAGFRNLQIQIRPMSLALPQFLNDSKDELKTKLLTPAGLWHEISVPDACVLALAIEANPSALNQLNQILLVWGRGKGIMILGDNDADAWVGLGKISESLKLDAGACAW